jgi:hypothetical protein
VSYLGIAVILLACTKFANVVPRADEAAVMHGRGATAD